MHPAGVPTPRAVIDGRFELVSPLDDHGLGEVWKARDTKFRNRHVAVKFLRALPPGAAALPEALAAQLKALGALRHASVLATVHHGLWQSRPFLVQDLFEGASLGAGFDKVRASGQLLALPVIQKLYDWLCAGIDAAHGASPPMVHGALDAGSVLIHRLPGKNFDVRVVDFGLAPWADRPGSVPADSLLAVDCRAPERAGAAEATVVADVYSLGVLLREMLAPLPAREDEAAGEGESRRRSDVPEGVWEVLARATATDPAARPATARALRETLRAAWPAAGALKAPASAAKPVRAAAPASERRPEAAPALSPRAVVEDARAREVPDEATTMAPVLEPTQMLDVPVASATPEGDDPTTRRPVSAPAEEQDTLYMANFAPDTNPWDIHGTEAEDEPDIVNVVRPATTGPSPVAAPSDALDNDATTQRPRRESAPGDDDQAPTTHIDRDEQRRRVEALMARAGEPPRVPATAATPAGHAGMVLMVSLIVGGVLLAALGWFLLR